MNTEPKSNVDRFELLDDGRVIVQKKGKKRLEIKHVYHHGTAGILCNDFETFIDFQEAKQVEFGDDND